MGKSRVVKNCRPNRQGQLKFVWTDNFMEIVIPNDPLKKIGHDANFIS